MRTLTLDDAALPRSWDGAVAVVGTRTPTRAAVDLTEAVVRALAKRRGTIVVSRLALGIDTRAHWLLATGAAPLSDAG